MAVLTNHGKKRIKERAGLPKKAVQASVDRAYEEGLDRTEFSGSLRRYIDFLYYQEEDKHKHRNTKIKIYGNMIYIFDRMVLITTFPLPRKFLRKVETVKEKKKRDKENEQ